MNYCTTSWSYNEYGFVYVMDMLTYLNVLLLKCITKLTEELLLADRR